MPQQKRQHYVPRLYLEYFSADGNYLTVFSIKDQKIVTNKAPISRQCYENYIYSDDPKFEQALSSMEGVAKRIINIVEINKLLPPKSNTDYFSLLVFVLFQSARTIFAAEQINNAFNEFTRRIMKSDITLRKPNNIKPEDVDNATFSINNPALMNLSVAAIIVPLLLDLNAKVIINTTNTELVTSDNPVVLYNKYYLNSSLNYTGFACKGLIIILPLSPFIGLIYYDKMIYRVGEIKCGIL